MKYMIFKDGEESKPMVAPVGHDEVSYMTRVLPHLRPMNVHTFVETFGILSTSAAPSSIILDSNVLFWLFEWEPGLIVLKVDQDGNSSWAALRSPIPEFGGREPLPQDEENYDEDAPNYQYNLIFNSWDAQFDEECREEMNFAPADDESLEIYRMAMNHWEPMFVSASLNQDEKGWRDLRINQLGEICGEGSRI